VENLRSLWTIKIDQTGNDCTQNEYGSVLTVSTDLKIGLKKEKKAWKRPLRVGENREPGTQSSLTQCPVT
jgi:hypothetical protein